MNVDELPRFVYSVTYNYDKLGKEHYYVSQARIIPETWHVIAIPWCTGESLRLRNHCLIWSTHGAAKKALS